MTFEEIHHSRGSRGPGGTKKKPAADTATRAISIIGARVTATANSSLKILAKSPAGNSAYPENSRADKKQGR